MLVDGDAADVAVGQVEAVSESATHGLQRADALVRDFGAYTVATHDCNVELQDSPPKWCAKTGNSIQGCGNAG